MVLQELHFSIPKWYRVHWRRLSIDDTDEESTFVKDSPREDQAGGAIPNENKFFRGTRLPWLLVAILSLFILFSNNTILGLRTTKILYSSTDFVSARSVISKTKVKFSSSLGFVDKDNIFRIYDDHDRVYVGNATSEIDRAWDDLILPADIWISEKEAKDVGSNLYKNENTGKYRIELEVFHSLHCLNMIRMKLYGEAYPHMQTHKAKIHIDHCLESLRELIMCGGDMTPIPLEWSEKGERLNPNYATTHSCRDFSKLKEWMKSRS